jgi:hypothetical protein
MPRRLQAAGAWHLPIMAPADIVCRSGFARRMRIIMSADGAERVAADWLNHGLGA